MKLKYLIFYLCLFFYCYSAYAQDLENTKDFNGHKWRKYNIYGYYGRFSKYAQVTNVLINRKHISARMAHFLKSSFSKENKLSKSNYIFVKEFDKLLDKVISNDDYSGVDIEQYVDGLDSFYRDSRNLEIPIHLAMIIVKREIAGDSRRDIDNYIKELREKYAKSKG
jgi:hypothetical protein